MVVVVVVVVVVVNCVGCRWLGHCDEDERRLENTKEGLIYMIYKKQ